MAPPLFTASDLPPEIWADEICAHLDDYARASLLLASKRFRALLHDLPRPKQRCNYCCGERGRATLAESFAAYHPICASNQLSAGCAIVSPNEYIARASEKGWSELLRVLKRRGCHWSGHETRLAAANGHAETLRVLKELGCGWAGEETFWAARNGHVDVLYALRRLGCAWSFGETCAAARRGHIEVLLTLRKLGCPWSYGEASERITDAVQRVLIELKCPDRAVQQSGRFLSTRRR